MRVFDRNVWFGARRIVDGFAAGHRVGFCLDIPADQRARTLAFSATTRAVPLACLCTGAATKTEDQGSSPECAAYSATSYAENLLWRKTGRLRDDLDPHEVYAWAKAHDGSPESDGTTILAVLDALCSLGHFDPASCRPRLVWTVFDLKAAVHRYGTCLLGMDVSEEWYRGNSDIRDPASRRIGGHAVQCVGYDQVGVWIQNSWGRGWGLGGFARVAWPAFERQFMHGGFLEGALWKEERVTG